MVIPEHNWEQKQQDLEDNDIDVYVMGSDWEGKFDFCKEYCTCQSKPDITYSEFIP